MRYLSTILLASTVLTATTTYGALPEDLTLTPEATGDTSFLTIKGRETNNETNAKINPETKRHKALGSSRNSDAPETATSFLTDTDTETDTNTGTEKDPKIEPSKAIESSPVFEEPGVVTSFSPETQAQIDAFAALLNSIDYQVSTVLELLFDHKLYQLISWRSPQKDPTVVETLLYITADSFKNPNYNSRFIASALFSIIFPDEFKTEHYTDLSYIVEYTKDFGRDLAELPKLDTLFKRTLSSGTRPLHSGDCTSIVPLELAAKLYLELLERTNITPASLAEILTATIKLIDRHITKPSKSLDLAL